jgi:hypothetical protein
MTAVERPHRGELSKYFHIAIVPIAIDTNPITVIKKKTA